MGVGMLVHIVTMLVPVAFVVKPEFYSEVGLSTKLLLTLAFPNVGMYFAASGIVYADAYEGRALGLSQPLVRSHVDKYTKDSVGDDEFTMGLVWLMFCTSAVVYGLLTAYLDAVNPGKFGQRKSPLFCFKVTCPISWFTGQIWSIFGHWSKS